MKKTILALLFAIAMSLSSFADTVTNFVYVISNSYIHTFHENVITQRIQNTHKNYYYYITNNTHEVREVSTIHYTTNTTVEYTQQYDVSQQAIQQAQNYANQAYGYSQSASSSASSANTSVGRCGSHSDSASYSASRASSSAQQAGNYLAQVTAKQSWFDRNFGKMVTNVNVTVSTNLFFYEDEIARAVSSNALIAASNAVDTANSASAMAASASASAGIAIDIASDVAYDLTNALILVTNACHVATNALDFSTNAYLTASNALVSANTAVSTASSASTKANKAKITADTALLAVADLMTSVNDNHLIATNALEVATNAYNIASNSFDLITNETTRAEIAEGFLGTNIANVSNDVEKIKWFINPINPRFATQVVYRCRTDSGWTFKLNSEQFTVDSSGFKKFTILEQNPSTVHNNAQVTLYMWTPESVANFGIQIYILYNGWRASFTSQERNRFVDSFSIRFSSFATTFTFDKISEVIVPAGDSNNILVKEYDLFGDSFHPSKSQREMLDSVISNNTSISLNSMSDRISDVEFNTYMNSDKIIKYTGERPYVIMKFEYTGPYYNYYLLKIYVDSATILSQTSTQITYGYQYEILDSSMSQTARSVKFVKKIVTLSDPTNSVLSARMYMTGYTLFEKDGFPSDKYNLHGNLTIGQYVPCTSTEPCRITLTEKQTTSERSIQYYISSDYNVYSNNGVRIGRIMTDSDWNSLSNWVEQTFQRR